MADHRIERAARAGVSVLTSYCTLQALATGRWILAAFALLTTVVLIHGAPPRRHPAAWTALLLLALLALLTTTVTSHIPHNTIPAVTDSRSR